VSFGRPVAVLLVVGSLVAAACGSGTDVADTPDPGPQLQHEPPPAPDPTDPPSSPVPFDDAIASINSAVEQSGGDLCALITAMISSQDVQPDTAAEVELMVSTLSSLLRVLATHATASDAVAFDDVADALEEEGSAAGYSVDWIKQTNGEYFNDPALEQAFGNLGSRAIEECDIGS